MTTELIEGLLLAMTSATDTLGVPLFREEMKEIGRSSGTTYPPAGPS